MVFSHTEKKIGFCKIIYFAALGVRCGTWDVIP